MGVEYKYSGGEGEPEWLAKVLGKVTEYEYKVFTLAEVKAYFQEANPKNEPITKALAEGFRWVRTDHWSRDGSDWAVFEKQVV